METGSDFVHIICKREECFESESDNSVTDRQESAKQWYKKQWAVGLPQW
jgi:hypothetical protein